MGSLGRITSVSAVDVLITDPTAPGDAIADLRALEGPCVILALRSYVFQNPSTAESFLILSASERRRDSRTFSLNEASFLRYSRRPAFPSI